MAQFEQKRKKKLCINEIGGVKMKKKSCFAIQKKHIFLYCSFLPAPLALHSKDDL